jgi:hypothetical protein
VGPELARCVHTAFSYNNTHAAALVWIEYPLCGSGQLTAVLREIRRAGLRFFEVDFAFLKNESAGRVHHIRTRLCSFSGKRIRPRKTPPPNVGFGMGPLPSAKHKFHIDNALAAKTTAGVVHNGERGFHIHFYSSIALRSQHATHESKTKYTLFYAKGLSAQPDMFWRTHHTKSDPKSMRVMPLCLWGV